MPASFRSLLPHLVFSFLLCGFWFFSLIIEQQNTQYLVGALGLILLSASFAPRFKDFLQEPFYLSILRTSVVFVLIFFIWNIVFRTYSDNTEFTGNIFRGAFYNFQSPSYFHIAPIVLKFVLPVLIGTAIFIGFLQKRLIQLDNVIPNWHWLIFSTLILLAFSWYDNIQNTFISYFCHYNSFNEDAHLFASVTDVLKNFVSKMGIMGVHNNHYPPGTMIILKAAEGSLPILMRSVVILATILTVSCLDWLLDYFNASTLQKNLTKLLYLSSTAILFFPQIAIDPITLPLVICSVYFVVRAIAENSIKYTLLFALVFSAYLLISFTSIIFLAFVGLYVLSLIYFKELKLIPAIKIGVIAAITIAIIYALLNLLFGFNILDCFNEAVINEKKQMNYNAIDNVSRYIIISSGNIIAYLMIIGVPVIGVFAYGFKKMKNELPVRILALGISIMLTLLILGFSSHFFLETERIWIFLTPFILLVAAYFLASLHKTNSRAVSTFLISTIVICFLLKVKLSQCF